MDRVRCRAMGWDARRRPPGHAKGTDASAGPPESFAAGDRMYRPCPENTKPSEAGESWMTCPRRRRLDAPKRTRPPHWPLAIGLGPSAEQRPNRLAALTSSSASSRKDWLHPRRQSCWTRLGIRLIICVSWPSHTRRPMVPITFDAPPTTRRQRWIPTGGRKKMDKSENEFPFCLGVRSVFQAHHPEGGSAAAPALLPSSVSAHEPIIFFFFSSLAKYAHCLRN